MRFVIACLVALGLVAGSAAVALPVAAADNGYVVALAQQPPTGQLNVEIDTDGGGGWWANPVWIAIGVIALVLLIVIIAMAGRGSTTVIKE